MRDFQIPPEIISVDEALLLRFKSDDTINSKGFSAAYVIIDDGENFDYEYKETGEEEVKEGEEDDVIGDYEEEEDLDDYRVQMVKPRI